MNMTPDPRRPLLRHLAAQDDLNFLLTNRIPRDALTRLVGLLSKVENPLVSRALIGLWRMFADLDLSDSSTTKFRSMHECFTRGLRPGSRPADVRPDVLCSPSDGIVGACGRIQGDTLLQAKGSAYTLGQLLGPDDALVEALIDGQYLTLRLTSGMYHRFHAPHDCRVQQVTYVSGETYNVNPPALQRIPRLFCRNERAIVRCRLDGTAGEIVLVPVAAVLVASIRLHFLDVLLHLRYKGPNVIPCDARLSKGEEMGWFEHGSTIIVLAPHGFKLHEAVAEGVRLRAGQPAMIVRASDARRSGRAVTLPAA